jgi:hypothetical protein
MVTFFRLVVNFFMDGRDLVLQLFVEHCLLNDVFECLIAADERSGR